MMKPTRLSEPAVFSDFVQPISLPSSCAKYDSMCLISDFSGNDFSSFEIWATDKHGKRSKNITLSKHIH